ncbi:MAG: hypothetical protein ACUVTD_09310 [Nitrososphaerales archaeon]
MAELSPKRRVFATLMREKLDRIPVTSLTGASAPVNVKMKKVNRDFLACCPMHKTYS